MSGKSWEENNYQILPLSLLDLNSVYQLDQICFPKSIAFPKEAFLYFLSSQNCLSFGVKEGEDLLGFIIIQAQTRTRARLITLDIKPEKRRRKIGQRLLEFAHQLLKGQGFKVLGLETAVTNQPAINLYQKLGYQTKGIKRRYYPDGTDALLMERIL